MLPTVLLTRSCRATCWCHTSFSTHRSSSCRFMAVPLVLLCDGSCLLLWEFQVSSTVHIGTSNEELSFFLQHAVFTEAMSTEALEQNLEIQRGHDQLTKYMWLHWKSCHVLANVSTYTYQCQVRKSLSNIFVFIL